MLKIPAHDVYTDYMFRRALQPMSERPPDVHKAPHVFHADGPHAQRAPLCGMVDGDLPPLWVELFS